MAMNWTTDQVTMLNIFQTKYKQHEINGTFTSPTMTFRISRRIPKALVFVIMPVSGTHCFRQGARYSTARGLVPISAPDTTNMILQSKAGQHH
jgi:hypothetical protein